MLSDGHLIWKVLRLSQKFTCKVRAGTVTWKLMQMAHLDIIATTRNGDPRWQLGLCHPFNKLLTANYFTLRGKLIYCWLLKRYCAPTPTPSPHKAEPFHLQRWKLLLLSLEAFQPILTMMARAGVKKRCLINRIFCVSFFFLIWIIKKNCLPKDSLCVHACAYVC